MRYKNKKAQVWIETVLYTLIGLALIGMVLGFALPKINASKDRILVEQAITAMSDIDAKISEVLKTPGNVRHISTTIRKGDLTVNGSSDTIIFSLTNLAVLYSEPGVSVNMGNVKVVSEKGQKTNSATLTLDYSDKGYNITVDGSDGLKKFTASSTPYDIRIESKSGITVSISEEAGK